MAKLHEIYQGEELQMVKEDLKKNRKIITKILNNGEVNPDEWYYIEMMIESLNFRLKMTGANND